MRFTTRPAPPLDNLGDLRAEIDRIDAEMHALLIQRGSIIDRLIAVKRTSASGSAFRPGREASMMRRVAERHRGLLPLDTVEGIWRVIIATFTYVQAPFSVHADVSGGDPAMRDSARFHFGFTVPYRPHPTCLAVIEAVAASRDPSPRVVARRAYSGVHGEFSGARLVGGLRGRGRGDGCARRLGRGLEGLACARPLPVVVDADGQRRGCVPPGRAGRVGGGTPGARRRPLRTAVPAR